MVGGQLDKGVGNFGPRLKAGSTSFLSMIAVGTGAILGILNLMELESLFRPMDQSQQALRHAAAQAFIESLDQLATCFESADLAPEFVQSSPTPSSPTQPEVDQQHPSSNAIHSQVLQSLEDAAADIDQFIQSRLQQ
jgi:hypothetical protein